LQLDVGEVADVLTIGADVLTTGADVLIIGADVLFLRDTHI